MSNYVKAIDISSMVSKYRINVKRLTPLLVALAMLVTPLTVLSDVLAASASISLSGPRTAAKGSTISVRINVRTDTPVNGAGATLSYPANLLDYVSVSNSGAFSVAAGTSGGGGTVKVERGALSPVSGTQTLATVRFRAKVDTGSATINVTGGNVFVDSSDIYSGGSGLTVALTPPAAAPEAPPQDTTAPKVSEVKVTEITINSATITWKTDEPSNSVVNYGFNNQYGITAQDNNMVTEHKVTLNPAVLGPVTKVHFQVKSTDGAGNIGQSEDESFTTKGFTLNLKVTNKNNKKPVKGAVVKLENSKEVTTNDKGIAKVEDLPGGTVLGTVTYKGKETFVSINIKPLTDPSLATQDGTVAIDAPGTNLLLIGGLVLLLLALAGAGWAIATGRFGGGGSGSGFLEALKNKLPSRRSSGVSDDSSTSDVITPPEPTELGSSDPSTSTTDTGESTDDDTTIIRPNGSL